MRRWGGGRGNSEICGGGGEGGVIVRYEEVGGREG